MSIEMEGALLLGGNTALSARRLNNRNVTVRNVEHKGQGVFADRHFLCGETVVIALVEREEPERTRYSVQMNWNKHVLMTTPAVLINHSCNPNTVVINNSHGAYDFVAFRDISAGEELSFDYATTEFEIIAMNECFCAETNCRSTPGGFNVLPDDHALKLHGLVGGYLLPTGQERLGSTG